MLILDLPGAVSCGLAISGDYRLFQGGEGCLPDNKWGVILLQERCSLYDTHTQKINKHPLIGKMTREASIVFKTVF